MNQKLYAEKFDDKNAKIYFNTQRSFGLVFSSEVHSNFDLDFDQSKARSNKETSPQGLNELKKQGAAKQTMQF